MSGPRPQEAGPAPHGAPASSAAHLDALQAEYELSERWRNGRYAWVKRLLPAQKGRIGEQLFAAVVASAGLPVGPRTSPGHDLRAGEQAVEVKLSTLYDTSDPDRASFKWLQLRPADDYDVVALLGVEPDRVRVWVVDKDTLLPHTIGQHGGRKATETRMLELHPRHLPPWIGPDLADDGPALRRRLDAQDR